MKNLNKQLVVVAIPSFTMGGAELQGLLLSESLKRAGENVQVLAFGKKGSLITEIEKKSISWCHFPLQELHYGGKISKLIGLIRFLLFLRKKKISHLIASTYFPNIYCGAVYKYARIKNFYWYQVSIDKEMPISRVEKIAQKNKPIYIANSRASADFIQSRHNLKSNSVTIIQNGLQLNLPTLTHTEWRAKLGIDEDSFLAVMSANFYPEKDYATLIRAWKEVLQKTDRKVHLAISGEAPGASSALHQTKALAYDLGLCGKISFLGSNADNPGLFAAANLGILSSFSEGLSNVILEYMASGLPIIVSDIPGNREALIEPSSYSLFKVGDHMELAAKIQHFINNEEECEKLGGFYKKLSLSYSLDKMSQAFQEKLSL